MMRMIFTNAHRLGAALVALAAAAAAHADGPADFQRQALPLLQAYCYDCHNAEKHKGGVDLTKFKTEDEYRENSLLLADIEHVLHEEEMPPDDAKQPPEADRKLLLDWAHGLLKAMENAAPNDPGIVVMPRLNHREYDFVVRDLTGRNLKMGQFLTADSGGGEGFLNVGAALPMQVGNFESFLATGKKLLGHARILPNAGFVWFEAPQPPGNTREELAAALKLAREDWFTLQARREVGRQGAAAGKLKLSLAGAYLEAAWRYKHRAALGQPQATFEEIAAAYEFPLFPGSVEKASRVMGRDRSEPMFAKFADNPMAARWVERFDALPAPASPSDKTAAREGIREMEKWRKEVVSWVTEFAPRFTPLEAKREHADSQAVRGRVARGEHPYLLDLTTMKGRGLLLCVSTQWDGPDGDCVLWRDGVFEMEDGRKVAWQDAVPEFTDQDGRTVRFGGHPAGATLPPGAVGMGSGGYLKFTVPDGARRFEVLFQFDPQHGASSTVQSMIVEEPPASFEGFTARFTYGRELNDPKISKTRNALSMLAEWDTTNEGYIKPRAAMVWSNTSPAIRGALGITDKPVRWEREHLLSATHDDVLTRAPEAARAELREIENLLQDFAVTAGTPALDLEPQARALLAGFAARAWRCEPSPAELDALAGLFRTSAGGDASFEGALKQPLAAVLISVPFLYRFQESKGAAEPYPISGMELATRLAFLLWSSLPDQELLDLAAANKLGQPGTIEQQVRRMLADPRAAGFIDQFVGIWLEFADFATFSGPDAEKFKTFTGPLKEAMFDEAALFFLDLFQNDKPLTLALDADYTFLNETLAKHYGIAGVTGSEMRRVPLTDGHRGGILAMGAFLTKKSAPLRTSPVKRGVWVYEQILGQKLGEPPPNVPLLSDDEKNEAGMTIAQQLAAHRDNPACRDCHAKFDALGIALENFDPIGRWRTDIEGAPVDATGGLAGGKTLTGFADLRAHVIAEKDEFVAAFCRKLLSYALGRAILPSDKPLLSEMAADMRAGGYKPSVALNKAVNSRQFRFRRDDIESATAAATGPNTKPNLTANRSSQP